ncbi:MAG: imidazole glycerol phosphate synthase subunit HisH [Bacillota bacterium]
MKKLVIVDSGSANLYSIFKACEMVSLEPEITADPATITAAKAVIFPGVGFFDHAVRLLNEKRLTEALLSVIDKSNIPVLGICLGMQLLLTESDESAVSNQAIKGLNAIAGKVKRFPPGLPVPHVGWNKAIPTGEHPLFAGLEQGAYFYFTHSYYAQPDSNASTIAHTDYGFSFTSAAAENNVMGVQFHPEKSGPAGLHLLANFGKIIADQ